MEKPVSAKLGQMETVLSLNCLLVWNQEEDDELSLMEKTACLTWDEKKDGLLSILSFLWPDFQSRPTRLSEQLCEHL